MTGLTEHILDVSGWVLLAVLVALLTVAVALFRPRNRIPDRPGWLAVRFRTGAPTGLALTAAVLTLAACAWSLALLTFSVVHHLGVAQADPRVLASFTGHRAPWLTSLAKVLTWLGSTVVLWPVAIVAGLGLWRWRRRWLPAAAPALALAGAGAGSLLIKGLVDRPRPPVADRLTVVHSSSYPSEHAAQALATWGMLALVLMAGRSPRARELLAAGAALIAFVVGLTRLYLGAHWMTDVLGGWSLAGVWDCLLIICYLLAQQMAGASPERRAGGRRGINGGASRRRGSRHGQRRCDDISGQTAGPGAARPGERRQPGEGAEIAAALRRVVGGEVRFDPYSRHLFSRDASMYAIEPIGVVFPRDADDVAAVVSTAGEFGVPVLPRGAGTSLAGQTVGQAIVMDLSRHMSRIIEVDAEQRSARVQPGVVQEQLNLAAARHGLVFGPDTSTSNRATLGGMIGNNSAGSMSVRYGMTVDHVLALDVVLSDASRSVFGPLTSEELLARAAARTLDGAICQELPRLIERHREAIATGFPRFWRRAGGYRLDRLAASPGADLAKFVVGSEGTLVTVVGATVRLVPAPRHRVIAVGHFTSVQAAIEATEDALACQPTAVELIDKTILELSRQKLEYRALGSILRGDPEALLFVTFTGDTQAEAAAGLDRLDGRWQAHGHGYHTLRAVRAAEQAALLKVRSAGLGLLMAASTGTRRPLAFVEDTAVEPAVLAAYASRFRQILDSRGLRAGFYGHASVGCLHVRPFIDLSAPGQAELMRTVAEEVRELVLEFGGANSSEHGDGLARSEFNRRVFGDQLYAAMQETKRLFDPENRMNPGKIVDAPAMTDHLRDVAQPARPELTTRLHFGTPGGVRGAADRCMNIGLCRKESAGVMCPSYMATHDEEHSTRGRANALLYALSTPDPRAALGDDRLHGILDLCLECKACKSECPLGVDMAALKTEALAAYHDQHGIPLRSRLFGSIRALNRLGSATFPLSNLAGGWRPARRAAERWLGITAARPLPRFQRHDLRSWLRHRAGPAAPASQGELIFLADSFTTFTEPSAGRAAIELLELAGWQVRFEDAGCCGRASLSKGLVEPARRMAAGMAGRLGDAAARGVPITGVEPSCLLTLRDEYLALLPADPGGPAVAAATRLPEELLLEAIAGGRLVLPQDNPFRGHRILFHGHCHQKALAGTAASTALLRSIPGADVTEVDAGCCGMAGSFGFEAEHYQLSMRIGGLRLFPAIRAEPDETIIAATGVSCRQQIGHGTGRLARHPLEIIRQALPVPGG